MTDTSATPGLLLRAEVLVADDNASADANVFCGDGTVLLTVTLQRGTDVSQVLLGLTAHQTLQLIERLSVHACECRLAIAEGHGGARFVDKPQAGVTDKRPPDALLDVIGKLHAALALASVYIETMPADRIVDKNARNFVLTQAEVAFDAVRHVIGMPDD